MTPLESQLGLYYEFGPFRLDPGERRFYRDGEIILLPPKEFDLLLLLVRGSGKLMDRESLIKALWPKTVVEEANLNVHISALRKTLGETPDEYRYIETLPRLGYRFIAPVIEVSPQGQMGEKTLPFKHHPSESMLHPLPFFDGEREWSLTENIELGQAPWYRRTADVSLPIWMLALAALGILLGVLLLKFYRSDPAESASPADASFNVVPLTTFPGHEYHPAFSPDGNRIAFVWTGEKGGNPDIYVRLVDGGNTVRLTTDPGDDVNPVWSPDGSMIAFYRSSNEGDGVYIMPSLGGSERKLTNTWANRFSFGSHTWLHWSSDGKWLVLSDKASAAEPFSLFLISPETGERRRLTSPPATNIGDCSPAFSPDSKEVAFVRVFSAVVGEVYLVPIDGGEPTRLTHDGGGASNLTWALNGREIIFSTRYGGRTQLHRISVDGGAPQWLAASGNDAHYPSFSPQGNRLAWTKNTSNSDIFRAALTNNPNHDASKPVSGIIVSTAFEGSPQYSPDGKRIVFQSSRSGDSEIWVCDSEGNNPIRLTSFRGPLTGSPNWSPDGRQIVFDSRPEGNADIYSVSSEGGGQLRRLTTDPGEDIVPSFSHDGRWIYFCSSRSGRLQIWRMAQDGSIAVQVTKDGGFEPRESPDGRWLYYAKDRGSSSIWRIPVSGGEETAVYDQLPKTPSRMWAVVNEGIYFGAVESSTRSSIKFYSFFNGSVKTVVENISGSMPNSISGLSISPDGRWALFPILLERGSDLMMIENYR
jgi:Tol biopolymer transport system component/DNA-binding winged helix-turn-helix (wHTH) protein